MAESQKETSSVNRKEKKSLLDDGIGKEFLSSWKSMSVTEDDTMDFNFNNVSSSKKKAFDFEKIDMDFNLDGDFNKLSSFKIDVSDFNFSSPSKKVVKTKEKSEKESSTGNQQGKKNQFDFSFDFNELDAFNFDSSLLKEEKASKNQDGKKEISSDGNGCRGSKSQLDEVFKAFDDTIAVKLPACEDVAASMVETVLAGPEHLNSIKNDSAKCLNSAASILSHGAGPSPEKVTNNRVQHSHLSDEVISKEQYSQQATLDFSVQSLVGIESKQNTPSDGQIESCEKGTGLQTTSCQKEDVNEKLMAGVSFYHENLLLKNSSPQYNNTSGNNNGVGNKSDRDIKKETVAGTELAEVDLNLGENLTSFISGKAQHDIKDSNENQNLTTEIPSALICREVLNSNAAQTGIEFCRNPMLVARESLKGEDVLQEGEKNVKNFRNIREGFISDGSPTGCKVVGNSVLHDEEATKKDPIMPASEKNVKDHTELALHVCPSSSSEKQTKSSTQISLNSKVFVSNKDSMRNANIKSAKESKLSFVNAGRKMPDISTLKVSKYRTTGANKLSLNSLPQKSINSLQNPEQKLQNTASETASPFSSSEKKLPQNLSMKRKTFELSNSDLASLKPLKRLSKSLIESRDCKEPLKRVVEGKICSAEKSSKPLKCLSESLSENRVFKEPLKRVDVKEPLKRVDVMKPLKKVDEEQVFIHENRVESSTKSIPYNIQATALESPQELNVMELEISSLMENDQNVEKAEAFTKELEDICNMLKKKREEAKEILVRAIVNNNNLLMLNHPIYEEKICKVKIFAAELMSKELKT